MEEYPNNNQEEYNNIPQVIDNIYLILDHKILLEERQNFQNKTKNNIYINYQNYRTDLIIQFQRNLKLIMIYYK